MPDNRDDDALVPGDHEEMIRRDLALLVSVAEDALPALSEEIEKEFAHIERIVSPKKEVARAIKNIELRREDLLLILSGRPKSSRHEDPSYALVCFHQLLVAAFTIGSRCSIPESARAYLHSASTRVARAGRDRGHREIIRDEAQQLWKKKPSFRSNMRGTAVEIERRVTKSLAEKKSNNSKGLHSSTSAASMDSKADQRRLTVRALCSEACEL